MTMLIWKIHEIYQKTLDFWSTNAATDASPTGRLRGARQGLRSLQWRDHTGLKAELHQCWGVTMGDFSSIKMGFLTCFNNGFTIKDVFLIGKIWVCGLGRHGFFACNKKWYWRINIWGMISCRCLQRVCHGLSTSWGMYQMLFMFGIDYL